MVGTIIERYLNEQQDDCEEDDTQKQKEKNQEMSIKVLRTTKNVEKGTEQVPPW